MSARESKGRGSSRPEGHPREPKSRAAVRAAEGRHRLPGITETSETSTVTEATPYEGRHRIPDGLEART